MARAKSFLPPRAKEALILYIALNTENYDRYLEYCQRTGIKPFTKYYLRVWIQRHRAEIQRQRLLHLVEIRQTSALDRQKRMAMLEDNARVLGEQIQHQLDHPRMDLRLLTALMEQQRKLLEAIARERGEWGMRDEGPSDLEKLHEALFKQMEAASAPQLPSGAIEGEYTELETEVTV